MAILIRRSGMAALLRLTSPGARIPSFALARYNGDGTLDQSFGSGGRVITNAGGLEGAGSLALPPDGKILAGGVGYRNGDDFAMARYNSDGSLDASFGSNGIVVTDVGGGADIAWDMAVQPDGKILLGGMAERGNLQASSFAVVRYNENGKIDSSFGAQGKALIEFSSGFDCAYAIALQPDGKIVLAGVADVNSSDSPFAITRLNSNGRLDSEFGPSGKVRTNFFGEPNQANAVALQSDGKIVVAGSTTDETTRSDFAIARYNNAPTFEFCVQDERNGDLIQFNSTNGNYSFTSCSTDFTLYGTGATKVRACKTTLNHFAPDRNVSVVIKTCANKAYASIEALSVGKGFAIFDSNPSDNTCACR